MPSESLEADRQWRANGALFFFSASQRRELSPCLKRFDPEAAVAPAISEAEAIRSGTFRLFGHHATALKFPPDWFENPLTHERFDSDRHWSRMDEFQGGDVKLVWELSRFAMVYPLVRAYWRTGREEFGETFWLLVADWLTKNPPNVGIHWRCGQEGSIRALAWLFGLYGFADATATTPDRVARMLEALEFTGHRIEGHIDYALSQNNNHGISESAMLLSLGLLFPQWDGAQRWERRGRALLEKLGTTLVYDDGTFSQHSFNYQRSMLHQYLWSIRLAEINHRPLSSGLRERMTRSGRVLQRLLEPNSGKVPNLGHNDSGLVLPLTNCHPNDFRPVVQASRFLGHGCRVLNEGAQDEEAFWLFGPQMLKVGPKAEGVADLRASVGGCYALRTESSMVFVHSPQFKHRPSQADVLHCDVWWNGINIAIDPGTFSYHSPTPWDNALAHARFHNVVTVDGKDPMERVSRFVWLPWAKCSLEADVRSVDGMLACFQFSHDGYQRLEDPARYRRSVLRLGSRCWLVLDRLSARRVHHHRLHWLLNDLPCQWDSARAKMVIQTPKGSVFVTAGSDIPSHVTSLVRADPDSPRGWVSRIYQQREPALSFGIEGDASDAWFWTLFSDEPPEVGCAAGMLKVSASTWSSEIFLNLERDETSVVKTLTYRVDDRVFELRPDGDSRVSGR